MTQSWLLTGRRTPSTRLPACGTPTAFDFRHRIAGYSGRREAAASPAGFTVVAGRAVTTGSRATCADPSRLRAGGSTSCTGVRGGNAGSGSAWRAASSATTPTPAPPTTTTVGSSLVARRRPREGRGRLGRTRGSGRGAAPGSATVPPSAPASNGAGKTASRTVLLSSPNHTTSSGSSQTSVSLQPVRKWPLALVPTRRWCHTGRERTSIVQIRASERRSSRRSRLRALTGSERLGVAAAAGAAMRRLPCHG